MRYREASNDPGRNLLSPRVEDDDELRGIGERRPPGEDEGATVRVAKTSELRASPQEAQKRLSSGFSRAHAGHLAMNVSAGTSLIIAQLALESANFDGRSVDCHVQNSHACSRRAYDFCG